MRYLVDLEKSVYRGRGKRTGTPGNYRYTYDEPQARGPGKAPAQLAFKLPLREQPSLPLAPRKKAPDLSAAGLMKIDDVTREQMDQAFPVYWYKVDWGTSMRGQGKRRGGMIMGGMSAAPRGVKSYPDWPRTFNLKGEDAEELNAVSLNEKRMYHQARTYGLDHGQAMTWVYQYGVAEDVATTLATAPGGERHWSRPGYEEERTVVETAGFKTSIQAYEVFRQLAEKKAARGEKARGWESLKVRVDPDKIAAIRLVDYSGNTTIMHRSTKESGKWQESRMDAEGEATGDTQHKDLNDALRLVRREGGVIKEIMKKSGTTLTIPLSKAMPHKYTKRWRGKDGTWQYEYERTGPRTPKVDLAQLPEHKSIREHVTIARKLAQTHKRNLPQVKESLQPHVPKGGQLAHRTKTVESALGKLIRSAGYFKTAGDLQDLTGARITVGTIAEVRASVESLKKTFTVINEDDYITNPKGSYRSHHLILEGPEGLPFELQVRTTNQNTMADWSHDIYKPQTADQRDLAAHPNVQAYETKMSAYFWARDNGRKANKPPCPAEAERAFGCL